MTFFGAALGSAHALSPAAAWIVLGVAGCVGALVWGPLVDRLRDGVPVALASGCCALGAAAVATGGPTLALLGSLAIGISFIGVPAMVGALLQQRESPARYPRAFALMTSVLGVGQILGPLVGGLIADRFGAPAAVAAGAATLAFASLLAARYRATARRDADARADSGAAAPCLTRAAAAAPFAR
jgi:predicted MFS family arabinose efflux permease